MILDLPMDGFTPIITYPSCVPGSDKEAPARWLMINAYSDRAEFMAILPDGHLKQVDFAGAMCGRKDDSAFDNAIMEAILFGHSGLKPSDLGVISSFYDMKQEASMEGPFD